MKVTDILVKEHDNILKVLSRTKKMSELDFDSCVDEYQFILNFIQEYSDEYHHMKEEDIYFEWIGKYSDGLKSGPVACMLKEHVTFRDLTMNAKNALLYYIKTNEHEAKETVLANLAMFAKLLESHIEKENQMLYPMAERLNSTINNGDLEMMIAFDTVEAKYGPNILKFEEYCKSI
jgi:hemerythrin-like domain-containing protein